MKRLLALTAALAATFAFTAGPALACGGLIGPNGNVQLLRTTTLAGYHDGLEHYVTAFTFAGGEGEFGSIVPLPAVPTTVERGGDWTLQRLLRETTPVRASAATTTGASGGSSAAPAEVILETRIDALDITVLKGGGTAVGDWARDHGFRLPPDAPEVLEFYAARSPIFLAARFDADAARSRGQAVGTGTPVHITMPVDNPWVPLRILALGKTGADIINADVYLLTDHLPTLLPRPGRNGIELERQTTASTSLLSDLRSDKGMEWVPASAWLTHVEVGARGTQLRYDLAVDASGTRTPSTVAAGLTAPTTDGGNAFPVWVVVMALAGVAAIATGIVLTARVPA